MFERAGKGRSFGCAQEGAVDRIRTVVLQDHELIADRGLKSVPGYRNKLGVLDGDKARNVQLVVPGRAGRCSPDLRKVKTAKEKLYSAVDVQDPRRRCQSAGADGPEMDIDLADRSRSAKTAKACGRVAGRSIDTDKAVRDLCIYNEDAIVQRNHAVVARCRGQKRRTCAVLYQIARARDQADAE